MIKIFSKFNNITNSEGNGIVGGKLVRPARPCRVCLWPATKDRLSTPVLVTLIIAACTSSSYSLGLYCDEVSQYE